MTIIGIDPGTSQSGIVVIRDGKIVDSGCWPNERVREEVSTIGHDLLAIEWIQSMGMSVGKEVFETCMWAGRFAETSKANLVRFVPRGRIKLHHCGSARAKDGNIVQSMKDKHGDKGTKKDPGFFFGVSSHAWQACAVALYCIEDGSHESEIHIQKTNPRVEITLTK